MAGLQGWIKLRFYHSFISKHCKWSIRQGNVQDSFWLSGCQVLQPPWAARAAPAGNISSLGVDQELPSLHHRLCSGWGLPLLPSRAHCNYWNQTTRKHLSKQPSFGINHSFNLTESDPTPLAATSALPSHPRSRCRVSEGNETCSLALPGKSLFKWSATDLVGILGSKTGFLENEIAPWRW